MEVVHPLIDKIRRYREHALSDSPDRQRFADVCYRELCGYLTGADRQELCYTRMLAKETPEDGDGKRVFEDLCRRVEADLDRRIRESY
jgi:hypothetical protein